MSQTTKLATALAALTGALSTGFAVAIALAAGNDKDLPGVTLPANPLAPVGPAFAGASR